MYPLGRDYENFNKFLDIAPCDILTQELHRCIFSIMIKEKGKRYLFSVSEGKIWNFQKLVLDNCVCDSLKQEYEKCLFFFEIQSDV